MNPIGSTALQGYHFPLFPPQVGRKGAIKRKKAVPTGGYLENVEKSPDIFAGHQQFFVRLDVQRAHPCPRRESAHISLKSANHMVQRNQIHDDPLDLYLASILMLADPEQPV